MVLSDGNLSSIDTGVVELIAEYRWHLSPDRYAFRNLYGQKPCKQYLHRMVLEAAGHVGVGKVADHINGDTLDNRLANLRFVSQAENSANGKLFSSNTSGYRGVSWYAAGSKWAAEITRSRRKRFLGYFPTAEEAALAYDRAATEHGVLCRLNFQPTVAAC